MITVKYVEELRQTQIDLDGETAIVAAYAPGRAHGGGIFVYDASDLKSEDNGGTIIVTANGNRWKRLRDKGSPLTPFMFGCLPGQQYKFDNADRLQAMINASDGGAVDVSGGPWYVNKTVDFTPCSVVYGDQYARLLADPTTFNGKWVATFGRDNGVKSTERWARGATVGWFEVVCGNRKAELNGIFIKGSRLNIGPIRASGFNGTGISESAVWDSTFNHVMTERCGSLTKWAYQCEPYGDTHNASSHASIQCEQAYHRGIYINAIRDTFTNIHAERLIVLTTDDGTTGLPSGLKYLNHSITLGNASVMQMVMDCDLKDNTTNETLGVTVEGSMVLGLDRGSIKDANCSGFTASTSFGSHGIYDIARFSNWYIKAPSQQLSMRNCEIDGVLAAESRCTFDRCTAGTFLVQYNAQDLVWREGTIGAITYAGNIQGDIYFYNLRYNGKVGGTKYPSGGAQPVTFVNCRLADVTGAYQNHVRVIGGSVTNVNLASKAYAEFRDVKIDNFDYAGVPAFITVNCQCANAVKWAVPVAGPWGSGALTGRIDAEFAASDVMYSHVDGSGSWAAVGSKL